MVRQVELGQEVAEDAHAARVVRREVHTITIIR